MQTAYKPDSLFYWECGNQRLQAEDVFPLTLTPLSIGIAATLPSGFDQLNLCYNKKVISTFTIVNSEEHFLNDVKIYSIRKSENFVQSFLQQLLTRIVFAFMNPIKRRHQRITMTVNDLLHLYNLYLLPVPVYLLTRRVKVNQVTFPIDLVHINTKQNKAILSLHSNNKNQLILGEELVLSNVTIDNASVISTIDRDLHQNKRHDYFAEAKSNHAANGITYPMLGNSMHEMQVESSFTHNRYAIYSCRINRYIKNDDLGQLAHTPFFAKQLKP
ncbi:MAG: hypothetical protein IPO27_13350 [Bacteroidetes bacterium]|nr:hypothetical protein [Bacteroidota bacterium]